MILQAAGGDRTLKTNSGSERIPAIGSMGPVGYAVSKECTGMRSCFAFI
jgi:hypothetical protein